MTEKSSVAPLARVAHNQRLFSARIGAMTNVLVSTALVISSVPFNPIRTIESASNDGTMFTSEYLTT